MNSALADKLHIPPTFNYTCFKEIWVLKEVIRALTDEKDALVVLEDYAQLRQALEGTYKNIRAIVVTGHPGIGSYGN
jgi:hypothetical protein